MIDLADHPFHPDNVARESGAPDKSERAWLRWVAQVEQLLGHDVDGNDVDAAGEGYSLDEAYGWWELGRRPSEYVIEVQSRERYDGGRAVHARSFATNRPGDIAAIYAEENGVDYASALVACNMD